MRAQVHARQQWNMETKIITDEEFVTLNSLRSTKQTKPRELAASLNGSSGLSRH